MWLYPPWWRDRYLEEARTVTDDLLKSGRSPWRIALNLSGGALRARLTATGMPPEAALWASRTTASIVLATAPALVVLPLMLTIKQVPAIPAGGNLPPSHLASSLYLALLLSFVVLVSTVIWGYSSLSAGLQARPENRRGLRMLAKMPGYAAVFAVALLIASIVIEPHDFKTHGKISIALNGHPAIAHALWISAAVTFCAGWLLSIVLLRAVARSAVLPLTALRSGTRVSTVTSVLLWMMSAAALTMSGLYSRQVSELGGFHLQSSVLGHSLLLLGLALSILSIASTLGTSLARRAWGVVARLG
jgi:hypothetical protein